VLEAARRGSGRLVHDDGMWAVTVTAASEHLGFLVIGGVHDLDDPDRRTIERAGVVTALLLLFERAAADAEQRMRTDLVSDLVSGRGEAAVRVARARSQGLDLGQQHAVLVARGRPGEPRRALLMSAHAAVGDGALVGEHDGDVVALVPSGDPQRCAGRVAARMGRSAEVTVGGAGPVTSVEDVPAAYAEASRTTSALVSLGRSGTGGSAQSLGFAGLLSGSAADVGAYVTRVLGSVLDYDRNRGTDLIGTLEAYYAAGGSPRHAATTLHVHANTVAQRLERVGLLLGTDWQRPEQALELQLALRLRRLMRS
jgi:sugar diacid utilization regulator